MAFSGVRSLWSSLTTRPAAAPHGEHNLLPQDSVIISDRTRRANKLGEGSFAKVFRGEYNGKPCAVKVFKEDVLKKELAADIRRGTSEVEMHSKVQHTNIVKMYGMWLDPHKDRAAPSIVMELCDESLYELIRRFKGKIWSKEKKLPLLQDIARGMVYLHDQNVVHGDLRSSNVLLCHFGDQTVAKLADFDMARLLDPDTQRHFTTTHTAEEYLPPEVFDHSEHKDPKKKWARLTPKVDVFCYGEIVLEMGCGAYPTPSRKYHGQEMWTELQRREKHMLKLKQSDKESLGSIIRKCLADAPEGRPSFTEILLEVEGKTAECEALRAEAVKWEGEAKSLCSVQDELEKELEKERTEKEDLQINLQMQQIKVEELQQQIQDISQRERDAAEKSLTMSTRLQEDITQLEDEVKQKESDMKQLHQQYNDCARLRDKYCNDTEFLQSEVDRLSSQLDRSKKERIELMEKWTAVEQQKRNAEEQVSELQSDNHTWKTQSESTEKEFKASKAKNKELTTKIEKLTAEIRQLEQDVKRLKDEIDQQKRRLDRAMALKETANRERDSAISDKERTKKELVRQMGKFAKERQQFEEQIAAEERAKRNHQKRLGEAQKKEHDLNDQLRQYRDKLEASEGAKDKLERAKEILEAEKVALEKKVRELTYKLEVRAEDLSKKESELQDARDDLKVKEQLVETRSVELKELHGKLVYSKEQMKNEQQRMIAEWNTLQETYYKVVNEKDKLTRDLVQVQQDKDDLQETLEEGKTAAKKELDKTKKEKDALREDLQAVHEALSKKTNEHAEVMKEVASLKDALEQKAGNIEELQSMLNEQEKVIQQLSRDRLNVHQEVQQLKSQRDTFKQKLDDAQASLKTSKEHATSVEEQLDQFQKKLREKESANAKLLQALYDTEGEMKEMKLQKAILERSAKGQDDRVTQLKKELERQRGMFAKERQQFQAQIAAEERAKRVHQETLEEARTAAEKELDKTKKEKDALREDLQATHEVLSMKTNEHAEVMKEVGSLREALEQKASNIGELQSKSHEQEKVIQQLNRNRLSVHLEVEQLKSQRDTFKQKLDDAQTSLKTSKEHTTSVEEQLDHLQKKLREKESANAKLLQSLNDKEGEMKEMKQQKAKLESSAKGQDDRITQLKTKADEMDVQLMKERQEWTLERNALQQQNAKLKKNVSEMDEQLKRESKKWQSEKTALKLVVAAGKEHAKILVAKLEETQSSMAATTAQLEQAAAARNKMETELQHLREKCDHLKQEHQQTLAEKVEELNSMKRESEREMQALKETHATLIAAKEKGLTEKSQDVARLQTELNAWKRKNEKAENELRASRTRAQQLASKNEELATTASQRTTEVKQLNGRIGNLERQVKHTTELKAKAEKELEAAKSDGHKLTQQLTDCRSELDNERKRHGLTKGSVKTKDADLQAEEAKVQAMENTAQEREKECDQIKKELEETVKTFETTVGALQKELEDTVEHRKTCESERDHLRDEKRVWVKREADLEDCVKKLKETCTDMEQSRMELHTQLKKIKAENEAAKTQQKADSKKTSNLQVALQAEKDKSCNAEETMRQKEEVKKYKADLQAEKDKVHIMEVAALQKDRDLDQCKDKLAQRKELDLNDQLRLYRNQLEATKVDLQVEKDKLHSKEESVCQKEEEVKKLKGDLQSERDKVQTMEEAALQKERELDQCKARKAAVEKDLVRARKMAKDLLDERVVVNAESEQKMENLNERLMKFKQQAVLSEERLKQVQGLEGEHQDLKVQLKTLTTTLEDFQKVLTDEQKSRKSLDASVKALMAEIDQLRTELKGRDHEVSSLAAANKHLQRKVDAADANSGEMEAEITQLRTELKERDNKVSSLTAANGVLQRKVGAADANIEEMKAKSTSLKEQVKALANDKKSLKQTLDAAEAAIQKHKNDYEDCQEKLREAEQQVALFQGKRQQLEVFERVAVELKSRLSDLMMDAPPLLAPSVGGGKDGSSAIALTQEAAQKVQQLERERDSLKAERHMYQMKWLAAEDMLEAVKSEKQSLENNLELTRQAFQSTKVHLQVTEQSLREEYKKKFSEAYEVMNSLQQEQEEGGAQHPPDRIKLDALMDICRYYKDERDKEIERAAAEKHCILASKKEADERAEAMACKVAALKECIEVRDGEIKRIKAQLVPHKMEAAPVPLPSDVVDVTADEALLQQLCYMATGIKKLLVSADGGRFTLGSGDASLEFPPGTVEKETSVRYAIILHGPFVFPAGYKPGSVIIYLNMEGATLLKPVILYLSHWCIKEKGEDEDTLKFASASHTLGAAKAGQQVYVFEEEDDADFTRTNVAVLSIRDPHCLFCVKNKSEKVAMYSAIAFSRYIPSEETLLFRIQLMCDSLEWNEKLTSTLQLKNWEKTSDGDIVTRFQCADGQHRITASPKGMAGPGWRAAIYGQQAVIDEMFLEPLRKTKEEVEQEVSNGRFPPCILYKIIYTGLEVNRVKSALVNIVLHGANVPLSFSCRVKEEMLATPPISPAYSEPVFGAATSPIPMETALVSTRDILTALDHRLDAKWRHFGTFLRVEYQVMEAIQRDKGGNPEDCMLDLLSKWISNQAGLGTLPRTWQTVVETVHHCGDGALAQSLARKHGGHLPH